MDRSSVTEQPPESGRLYRIVTRYWPRIAVVLVFAIGTAEWVIGGLTADSNLEVYLLAWAALTAGLWFLFEKAERALSEEASAKVAGWLAEADLRTKVGSIPDQFALLFDRVFGERHLSWRCFGRSAVASVGIVLVLFGVYMAGFPDPIGYLGENGLETADLVLFALVLNVIPDYVSLFETRFLLRFMSGRSRVVAVLLGDIVVTSFISFAAVVVGFNYVVPFGLLDPDAPLWIGFMGIPAGGASFAFDWETVTRLLTLSGELPRGDLSFSFAGEGAGGAPIPFGLFFYSAFFTSVWLWLYALSALLSRVLVRIGGGVGFLLSATDVKHQPFRSMGFTAVVLVSVGFLVGLPFVLLD